MDMTLKGLGEVFESDSADMCAGKFPLVSMGGRANGQACSEKYCLTTTAPLVGEFFFKLKFG
jgi:hypothetical protein